MSADVWLLVLAGGLAWLLVTAFSKKPVKSITGWLTVIFPPKKKGKKKK